MDRPQRFVLFSPRFTGFTCGRRGKVQFPLDVLSLVAVEIHTLLTSPLVQAFNHRFRLGLSVDSAFRLWSASLASPTTWPTLPSADFCSAVRLPLDNLSRRNDTGQISRGNFNRLLRAIAESTLCVLDGYGLRGK